MSSQGAVSEETISGEFYEQRHSIANRDDGSGGFAGRSYVHPKFGGCGRIDGREGDRQFFRGVCPGNPCGARNTPLHVPADGRTLADRNGGVLHAVARGGRGCRPQGPGSRRRGDHERVLEGGSGLAPGSAVSAQDAVGPRRSGVAGGRRRRYRNALRRLSVGRAPWACGSTCTAMLCPTSRWAPRCR